MTDDTLQQLAEKHRISGSDGALAAIREAYALGRQQGLEEAAKIVKAITDELAVAKNSAGNTEAGRALQQGVWALFSAEQKILQLTGPFISSSTNSVDKEKL